jgi:ubiquinone/menaquinone biosynthesis C-methylase UbiE
MNNTNSVNNQNKNKNKNKNNNDQDIFSSENYKKFIMANNMLTDCQKKNLINFFELKNTFFVKTNSNQQIISFFNQALKNKNLEEITRLQLLIFHFVNFKNTQKIMDMLYEYNNITDEKIVNTMINMNKNKNSRNELKNMQKYFKCDKWVNAIQELSHIYLTKIKPIKLNNDDIKYLDIGIGNGKKTNLFSRYLKVKKGNTFGANIEHWGPYQQLVENNKIKSYNFKFNFIKDNKLNYEDNSFDIITCISTLHHNDNLREFIKEIYRILKPNGIFLLIEHSVYDDYDRLFINIQHMFYTAFYDNKNNYIQNPDFIYTYNMYEWNFIMYTNKLKMIEENTLRYNTPFSSKYDNMFYAFYRKK